MAEELLPGFRAGEQEHIAYLFSAWRARQALEQAAEIVAHVRSLIGNGERGDTGGSITVNAGDPLDPAKTVDLIGLGVDSSPLRVTAADASDELYAELVEWVVYWAGKLDGVLPPSTAVAWRIQHGGEAYGFRAGTTVEGAALLTRLQTMWLLTRHDRIVAHPEGPGYVKYVTEQIWALRARFPMQEARRRRPTLVRACPICKGHTVEVEWFSEDDREGVAVICSLCGWMPEDWSLSRLWREVA